MTDKPYTDADADVELVAAALSTAPLPAVQGAFIDGEAVTRAEARAVLDALAAAGRLLPADAETREQWGARLTWDGTTVEHLASDSRENAQRRVDLHAKRLRETPGWRATAELVRREVHTTPWTDAATKDRP